MGLCMKCRMKFDSYWNDEKYPYIHCHHDEPEEKPKSNCWCKYPFEKRNNWNVSVKDKEGLPCPTWKIIYCPVCGKVLY